MALTSTLYTVQLEIADTDRGVYETLELWVAQHPSETPEFMLVRLLAYALEYTDGIALTEGVAAVDEPAILARDLTGQLTLWVEVGAPSAERVHRGSKQAARTAIYTHRDPQQLITQLNGHKIHRAGEIPVRYFDREFIREVAARLQRRSRLSITVTEGQLFLELDGHNFSSEVSEVLLGQGAA